MRQMRKDALPHGGLRLRFLGAISTGVRPYGVDYLQFDQLFTNRQLLALNTFSDLVGEAAMGTDDAAWGDDSIGL